MLGDPSLVVHLCAVARAASHPPLRAAWTALRDAHGLTEVAGSLTALDAGASGLVVAAESADGSVQSVLRRRHDLLYWSVALPAAQGWDAADRAWHALTHPQEPFDGPDEPVGGREAAPAWAVGESRVFVAHAGDTDDPGLTAAVRQQLPGPAEEVAVSAWETPDLLVCEAPGPDDRSLRRIAVVAGPPGQGAQADAWLWSDSRDVPPPLARHLAHAAKVRHQIRVHAAAGPAPDAGAAADRALADASGAGLDALVDAREALLARLTGLDGLNRRLLGLREMGRTVAIAAANLESAAGGRTGPFADDLALARWFGDVIADETAYLDLDRERVRDTLDLLTARFDAALQRDRQRLDTAEEARRRRGERVTLLQTALVGAALMVLAAVQAFEYRVDFLPASTMPAVIALLGALSLSLATLVLAVSSAGAGYELLVRFFGGLATASAGWVALDLLYQAAADRAAPAPVIWAVMVLLLPVGWATVRWLASEHGLRLRRADTPPT
ncbi:BN6_48550 family protein [Actinocorallia sp. API 0066]|uniref:CATRA conflict system CASPASE/TPR repeat-associated protein n=1 Tax=Actinocorallia sp. API 0066 TaxID=2896846 RepID=UPI001E61CE95|nr:CATRA conflict system CASPASE/TPR repeat-associated protein [Actinocorallia sp. API 0066]MCD0449687.1 BN6_48550 family protein [Actinocorallia sp. API 0066]